MRSTKFSGVFDVLADTWDGGELGNKNGNDLEEMSLLYAEWSINILEVIHTLSGSVLPFGCQEVTA